MDLDEVSRILSVNKNVLEKIRDSGNKLGDFVQNKNNQSFWDKVDDSLPPDFACELHRLDQIHPHANTSDFVGDFMTPCLEDFFLSFAAKEGKEVNLAANIPSIMTEEKEITKEKVMQTLENLSIWKKKDEETYSIRKMIFSLDTLLKACIDYKEGKEAWRNIPEFNEYYSEIEKTCKSLTGDFSLVFKKMNEFKYISYEQAEADINNIARNANISIKKFNVRFDICSGLRQLIYSVTNEPETGSEDLEEPNDWFVQRLQSLIEDGSVPAENQKHFALTNYILAARNDVEDTNGTFEQGSLSELLFTSSTGEVAPLPFTNATADIPKYENPDYVKYATRKFVAQTLMDLNYNAASISAVDILADVVVNELKNISKIASVKLQSAKKGNPNQPLPSAKSVIIQTLRNGKYDIRSMPK